jgi:hypothetical protein
MVKPEQLASSRFLFHLISDDEVIRDTDGVSLSVHGGVLLCAARVLDELRQEGFFAARVWQGWQIEITDDTGHTVLRVPLGAADMEPYPLAVY